MAEVLFSKMLSKSDANRNLAIPTAALPKFAGLERAVLQVRDWNRDVWKFRLYTRKGHYLKPDFRGKWRTFARAKGLRVKDLLIFTRLEDDQYEIHVFRETDFKLLGTNVAWIYVDQAGWNDSISRGRPLPRTGTGRDQSHPRRRSLKSQVSMRSSATWKL